MFCGPIAPAEQGLGLLTLHLEQCLQVAGQVATPAAGPDGANAATVLSLPVLSAGMTSLPGSEGVMSEGLTGQTSTVNISEPDADKAILQPLQTANQPPVPPGPDIVLAALAPTSPAVPGDIFGFCSLCQGPSKLLQA